ncbi:MAG: hypothetical protein Fur0025_46980 [Oscillatoriaceae cyanobacterium]
MDVLIESTKKFEDDLSKLSDQHQNQVVQIINQLADFAKEGLHYNPQNENQNIMPISIIHEELRDEWDYLLYETSMDMGLRIILSIDEDPIFDQIILTFFRIVHNDELQIAVQGLVKSLLKEMETQKIQKNAQIA